MRGGWESSDCLGTLELSNCSLTSGVTLLGFGFLILLCNGVAVLVLKVVFSPRGSSRPSRSRERGEAWGFQCLSHLNSTFCFVDGES